MHNMKWFHSVNPEWLAERKKYLTASDVCKLLPVTPTGRPRANLDQARATVWAKKQCEVNHDDVISSGVMARGHLLEPYAIETFNLLGPGVQLSHWDDALVYSPDKVSCSPDALDLVQPADCPVALEECEAFMVGEVKCYDAAGHYKTGLFTTKLEIEERWQLATAFYTMPTITDGFLILFNPNAKHPLFWHKYTRAELSDEIDLIGKVAEEYWKFVNAFDLAAEIACDPSVKEICITEDQIVEELLEEEMKTNQSLNP